MVIRLAYYLGVMPKTTRMENLKVTPSMGTFLYQTGLKNLPGRNTLAYLS